MSNKGVIVVISGFSGAGKGTIVGRLMEKYNDKYSLSISATTRNPRPGEEHGKHYFFISKEEFENMIENEQLVQYAQYVGNYYGTPKEYVETKLNAGQNVILEIEIQGALKIKKKFPDTKLLFVTAPSAEILKERLVGRGTETLDVVNARLSRAYEESLGVEEYDYLVVNDVLDEAVDLIDNIITAENTGNKEAVSEHTITSNLDFINNMRNELLSFSKGE